jgi:hypothetical protein
MTDRGLDCPVNGCYSRHTPHVIPGREREASEPGIHTPQRIGNRKTGVMDSGSGANAPSRNDDQDLYFFASAAVLLASTPTSEPTATNR